MAFNICLHILRRALDKSAFFQTSQGYVGMFSDKHQICRHFSDKHKLCHNVFLDKHRICWNFFNHALDMSAFFLLKSSRYVGIFSDENYLCRHFFKRALDIFEFFRNALDMSTCFQKNTRYVDISLDKHLIFRSNLQKFFISARGHFSLHNTYLRYFFLDFFGKYYEKSMKMWS